MNNSVLMLSIPPNQVGLVLSLPKSALFFCLLSSGEVFGSGSDDLNTDHSKAYKILVFPKE